MLNHHIQASVPRDWLDELDQAVMETQNEVEAQYIKKDGFMMNINMSHTKDNKAQFVRRALYPEMQHEENAKITSLCVPEDFDVNAKHMQEEFEPKEVPKNLENGDRF